MISQYDLAPIPRFANLNKTAKDWLIERIRKIELPSGAAVFSEGDAANNLYVLSKGSVKVVKILGDGRELILDIFFPGESIGEVALIDKSPLPANAIAMEDATLLLLNHNAYFELMTLFPDSSLPVIRDLSIRIRAMSRRIQELGAGEVEQRLALVILALANKTDHAELDTIHIELNRNELASMVGARIETVIRIISRWNKEEISLKCSTGLKVDKKKLSAIVSAIE